MVDEKYMGSPQDTAIQQMNPAETEKWHAISNGIKAQGALALMQINHPGRQSPAGAGSRGFLEKNVGPSAVPISFGESIVVKTIVKLLFGTPAEMSIAQIQTVINQFVDAARFAQQAGFDGVTIHAAHGYLLSDFLSPKSNTRTDSYGGTPEKRAKIIVEIIKATREVMGSKFSISVKMNSSDQQHDAGFDAVLKQVDELVAEGVDFLEISGGSYENPRVSACHHPEFDTRLTYSDDRRRRGSSQVRTHTKKRGLLPRLRPRGSRKTSYASAYAHRRFPHASCHELSAYVQGLRHDWYWQTCCHSPGFPSLSGWHRSPQGD
jgi:2,4-dienoyl-CoA reductase-like NADH-dependent reductase (Old Yellow Enzyme family)